MPTASRAEQARRSARLTRWRAPSTCGRRTKFARSSATPRRSSRRATAFCRTATRRSIRSRSSSTRTCCYTAQSIADIARISGKAPLEVAESLLRSRQLLFDVRELRPRPQLDDKVLTAWNGLMIAAFARASRVLVGGALGQENTDIAEGTDTSALAHLLNAVAAAAFIRHRMWDADQAPPVAPLSRRRCGDRGLRGGLRVSRLRAARVVPGHRRSRVAGVGARAAGAPGRTVLGRRGRRLVQHHRRGSVRAAADEGGLRRRRAVADVGGGDERADARAPDGRAGLRGSRRRGDRVVRRTARRAGPRGAVHGGGARNLDCRRRTDCDRRPPRCGRHPRHVARRRTSTTGRSR